jgi:signal transduction histidine kinase
MEAQKRFLAVVSHELRTPLAIMKTDFEVALRDPEPASLAVAARSGLEEIDNMGAMVDDLLLLNRIEARQERLSLAQADLEAVVRRVIDRLAGMLDAEQMQRALGNIVKNAIEHTPSGGHINVGVRTEGDRAVVAVTDTGCGIAPNELPRIFEQFYRASSRRASGAEGSGMGLAIAAWVVESHRGIIEAASELGAGTTIVIRLPL